MQIAIPFTELQMPLVIQEEYQRMLKILPDIQTVPNDSFLSEVESSIKTIQGSMEFLKTYCQHVDFQDVTAEISFFKFVKPRFHAHLIFWMTVLEIELKRPMGGQKGEKKFIKKQLNRLSHFFIEHTEFYQYYRSGQTYRDAIYFTRNQQFESVKNPHIIDIDPAFSVHYDYTVSKLLANEMIQEYLINTLPRRLLLNQENDVNNHHVLRWTASKTGLVELIYALQSEGAFNNGKAKVQEIADFFQNQFDIKLVNYYHTFAEVRLRKKNRTAFIDSLRNNLSKKMDQLDEQ